MNEYHPDTVSSPAETLREMLDHWTAQRVQLWCGLSPDHLARLLSGEARLTKYVIRCLGILFPEVPASFWRTRERAYRASLEKTKEEQSG